MTTLPIERAEPNSSTTGMHRAALVVLRTVGAVLLATNAGIHAYLWESGYRTIPTIGVLFLLGVLGASASTLAVLAVPRRFLAVVAALGALLELGTVGGLVVATTRGLFGFTESTKADLYGQSVVTEVVGTVVLSGLAVLAIRWRRDASSNAWW